MKSSKLDSLRIDNSVRERPRLPLAVILLGIALVAGVSLYFAIPRASDAERIAGKKKPANATSAALPPSATNSTLTPRSATSSPLVKNSVLTVSGYIVNRERIELSPRFMGVVKWIGVKKGDAVTNNQVVVLLDDTEYHARETEIKGRLEATRANLEKSQLSYARVEKLVTAKVETQQQLDDWRLNVRVAEAQVKETQGQLALIQTYIDWTIIRSPINGVILEKLVDPNELVTPQSFGGTRGPSTALIALADPSDLQVEIDLNEADVAKVYLGQKCRISPEAYPEKTYEGYVAEKAPEASRQKGTLQIKVQIKAPDAFLTPELSAKVDFMRQP